MVKSLGGLTISSVTLEALAMMLLKLFVQEERSEKYLNLVKRNKPRMYLMHLHRCKLLLPTHFRPDGVLEGIILLNIQSTNMKNKTLYQQALFVAMGLALTSPSNATNYVYDDLNRLKVIYDSGKNPGLQLRCRRKYS